MNNSRIGLALSGGGIRAVIFHLGALHYFAEVGIFSRIKSISTVSGASIALGLLFAVNENKWPTKDKFIHIVQPKIRQLILDNNIQAAALRRLPFSPKFWRHRVELLAKMLEVKWNVRGNLQDLPHHPFWEINCTTFETGNNFRIRRDYMGDSKVGYVQNPALPISHMIAASSAFPVLIGPYVLKTENMRWTTHKQGGPSALVNDLYTLWDGGVYDNLGLDSLRTIKNGFDDEIDFLIVSNASASIGWQNRRGHVSLANLRRLLEISMNQVDVLRSQEFLSTVINMRKGLYLKIGYTADHIADFLNIPRKELCDLVGTSLSAKDAAYVRDYPTTLNSPTAGDYDLIFRHGYENAKCVYSIFSAKLNRI